MEVVHNREVNTLSDIPSQLITLVDKLHVCAGHSKSKFINYVDGRKGKLYNKPGGVAAYVDKYAPIHLNGETFQKTVRTSESMAYI